MAMHGLDTPEDQNWADLHFSSHDGLTLYARHYAASNARGRPLICLPGLTRNSRDFHKLATFLSTHPTHRREVYCPDYRGRGRSGYDPDWRNYSPFIEMLDVLDLMAIRGLERAGMIGTSRGGIIAMLMGTVRPNAIGSLVLNDIGPVIETAGLARIMGYVGKTPLPSDWREARHLVRDMNRRFFTNLAEEDWTALAHQFFNEESGRPAPGYDTNLGKALSEIDICQKIPEMWPQFEALKSVPVCVLRGENSDLLSERTVSEMEQRHPRLSSHTIGGEGHAPLLNDRFSVGIIADFLRETDPDRIHLGLNEPERIPLPRADLAAGPSL